MALPEKLKQFEEQAQSILKQGCVRDLEFSGKTYQVQVVDPETKEAYWTFLQVDSRGTLHDFFCECEQVGNGDGCVHAAAAYLRIYNGKSAPLHVRFEMSLWNLLFRICSERYGEVPDQLVRKGKGHYVIKADDTKHFFFDIKALNAEAVEKVHKLIEERPPETEETSLKFSNLNSEEIARWRAGRPSSELRYELSMWNDLAKWMMLEQDSGNPYKIDFDLGEDGLPNVIKIHFADLEVHLDIHSEDLPRLIPVLATVTSSLKVHDERHEALASIRYYPEQAALELIPKNQKAKKVVPGGMKAVEVGGWQFVPGDGFYSKHGDHELTPGMLYGGDVDRFLRKERRLAQTLIEGTSIHEEPLDVSYRLSFDSEWRLHIEAYLKQPGDLSHPLSHLFGRWVYVNQKGFFEIQDLEFNQIETVIEPDDMPAFIQQHRSWLNGHEGFHCRLASIEAQLTYHVATNGVLTFGGKTHFAEEGVVVRDFGPWVYVSGQGFFSKTSRSLAIPTRPGTHIMPEQIPSFIRTHREELKQIPHFFSEKCPIVAVRLSVGIDANGQVICKPLYERDLQYSTRDIKFFDEIVFVEGEGFYELTADLKLPERFREEMVIAPQQLLMFLTQDVAKLRKDIVDIDRRLRLPDQIKLIASSFDSHDSTFLLKMHIQTQLGTVPLADVWYALKHKQAFLYSSAGLLNLADKQFEWLKAIAKQRVDRRRNIFELSTIDLIRLEAWEGFDLQMEGDDAEKARKLLRELAHFRTDDEPDLTGLNSTLRPYQAAGVKWLWFLYRHGLSGLLCDDMGLGKTHQTMGLLAAIQNFHKEDNGKKFLVVCPTSVLYHWEEKLKLFFPDLRIHVFIGTDRDLADFHDNADLLLTSYGIQRNEIELLSTLTFEIAIFDEIQVAKNHLSRLHHALLQIKAKMRLGLTGTPIENYLRELKSLFDVVLPGYMPSEHDYREIFTKPIEKEGDPQRKSLLRRLIKPFVLRRRKEDVLDDLPEKTEEIAHCDLLPKQRKLYNETLVLTRRKLIEELQNEQAAVPFIHIFALLTHLKQICDHPAVYAKDIDNYKAYESGKWNLFLELLSEARDSQQKVVVFSQYLGMLDIIESHLKEHGIGYAAIRGSTTNRGEQLNTFNTDPTCEVFVASLQAAGLGVDLTAASVVIHYDRWWNAARENQATDRVHRIGQTRGVQVFKLVTKDTFEERIDVLIAKKALMLDEIVGIDDHQILKSMDRRDLIALLQETTL